MPSPAEGIGTYELLLDVLSDVAVFVNLALVVFTSNALQSWSLQDKLIVFLAAEVRRHAPHRTAAGALIRRWRRQHGLLMLRFLLRLIPDTPFGVRIQLERQVRPLPLGVVRGVVTCSPPSSLPRRSRGSSRPS